MSIRRFLITVIFSSCFFVFGAISQDYQENREGEKSPEKPSVEEVVVEKTDVQERSVNMLDSRPKGIRTMKKERIINYPSWDVFKSFGENGEDQ